MQETQEQKAIKKGLEKIWVTWGMLLIGEAAFLLFTYYLNTRYAINDEEIKTTIINSLGTLDTPDSPVTRLMNLMYLIVAAEFVFAFFVRKLMLKVWFGSSRKNSTASAVSKYGSAVSVSSLILLPVGIFALVLFMCTVGDFQVLYTFVGFWLAGMLVFCPKKKGLERTVAAMKEKQIGVLDKFRPSVHSFLFDRKTMENDAELPEDAFDIEPKSADIGGSGLPRVRFIATREKLMIKTLFAGSYRFLPEQIASLEPLPGKKKSEGFFSKLGGKITNECSSEPQSDPTFSGRDGKTEIRICHTVPNYPEKMLLTFSMGQKTFFENLEKSGFRPCGDPEKVRSESEYPVRWQAAVFLFASWNLLFIADLYISKKFAIFGASAILLFFSLSITVWKSPLLQKLIFKPERYPGEIRPTIYFISFMMGLFTFFMGIGKFFDLITFIL